MEIEILRYVAVDDCGRAINPLIIEGQIHGGIAQGLGQALLERVVYDDEGQPLSGSFLQLRDAESGGRSKPRDGADRDPSPI